MSKLPMGAILRNKNSLGPKDAESGRTDFKNWSWTICFFQIQLVHWISI